MIGVGFAGVGGLGEALLRDLEKFPVLKLRAVQDTRGDVAAGIAERYGAAWHGVRFDDLLARPDVDAVAISTPNALHAPQAQAALRAGKHVLVQKPLALAYADAQATIELASVVQRLLFVDYSYRFLDTVRVLGQHIPGARGIRAEFHNIFGPGAEKTWFFDPRLSGGGALVDLGVHLLDLALWLLEPATVRLESTELTGHPVEHSAQLRLRLDEVPFELDVSWNAQRPASLIQFEIGTGAGRVRWQNVDGSFFRFRTSSNDVVLIERETTLREDTLHAFCSALETGRQPPIDARAYAVLDQAYGRADLSAVLRPLRAGRAARDPPRVG